MTPSTRRGVRDVGPGGRRYWIITLGWVVLLAAACAGTDGTSAAPREDHELIEQARRNGFSVPDVSPALLAAREDEYDGRVVRVCGVFVVDGAWYVFASLDDARYFIGANAVQVEPGGEWLDDEAALSATGKFACVEGIFDARSRGYYDRFVGVLRSPFLLVRADVCVGRRD